MKPLIPLALLLASYIYLATAVFGHVHGNANPARPANTAIPPRLFDNGEIARIAATGRKVIVQSAEWDSAQHCYFYTVTPLPDRQKYE